MLYGCTHMATVSVKGLKFPVLYRKSGATSLVTDDVITLRRHVHCIRATSQALPVGSL